MSVRVLCWMAQIKPFFAFSCVTNEHFIDFEMKLYLDGRASSKKHQEPLMRCEKCQGELKMKPQHKYWLSHPVCFDHVQIVYQNFRPIYRYAYPYQFLPSCVGGL